MGFNKLDRIDEIVFAAFKVQVFERSKFRFRFFQSSGF